MGNIKLILSISVLAILIMTVGAFAELPVLVTVGQGVHAFLAASLVCVFVSNLAAAHDVIKGLADLDDIERVRRTNDRSDGTTTAAELTAFVSSAMACLLTGGVYISAFSVLVLAMLWSMLRTARTAINAHDDIISRSYDKANVSQQQRDKHAAFAAGFRPAQSSRGNRHHDAGNLHQSPNVMLNQAVMADSLSVHATNTDSVCYSSHSAADDNYSRNSSCSGSSSIGD